MQKLKDRAFLSNNEYTRLKETLEVLSNRDLRSQIAKSLAFYKTKRKGLSFEDLFGEPLTPVKKQRTTRSSSVRASL